MAVNAWTDSLCSDRRPAGRLFLSACALLLLGSAILGVTPCAAQDADPPKPAEAKPEPKAKAEPEKPPADPPAEKPPADPAPEKPTPEKPATKEAPATTPPTAQPAAVAPQASTIDFSGLTNPAVAASLKLSAEQQTQITAIRTERDAALAAAADEAAKLTINNQADQKIAAALDDVQLRLLGALFSKKKLQFNFRFQKWEHVLEWIAEEANLSLVMDAPPPGTFNYADTKEYTPIQAIDLLNGWLLTKGYALIRRDRLLMCVSLKGGIPAGVVPRVTPAELPIRGKFELVTAMFPLEGRPAESALKEVQSLLGPHSDVSALEQTKQLAVTDTAGNLRAIEKLITSIPVPKAPAKPAPPAPPKPTLVVYPVKTLSIDKAIELLTQLVSGKIVGDNDARQISIHTVPDQHALAKQILDQLESNTGPDKQSRIELYTLKGLGPEGVGSSEYTELLATLQLIAPAAQFRFDAHTRKLVTWASPAEHVKIKESIDQLQRTGTESGARQLEVYALTKADPDTTLSLLKELLPDARLALDTKSRTLIAIASRRDQLAVAALLDQLQPETPRPDTPTLQSYPIETELTASETELLSSLVPDANVTVDADNKRLLVIASPDDQQAIQKAIEQMSETAVKEKPSLAAYPVADEVTSSVTDLLATLAPDAQVTVDAENKRLLVIASPADHEIVKNALEQVGEQPLDSQRELRSYTLAKQVDTTTASSLISSLVPKAQVTLDATNRRMMIVATSAEHTVIAKTIAQISDELSGQLRELRFYSLKTANGANVVTILSSLVVAAQVTHDDANNRLTVVATDEEHTLIASTLEKLQQAVGESEKNALRIYPVTAAQRTRFQAIVAGLTSELPGMQVITDAQPGELAIWAKPAQHAVVAEVLTQLQPVVPEEEKPKLISYPVTKADVTTVHEVLTTLFPETKITVDEKASRLLIWAQPTEHETIRSAIGQLDTDAPIETELKLMSYPIESLDPTVTLQLLQEELPKVIFVQDTTAGTLIARARVREHERIASLLETLRTHAKSNLERSVVVYPAVWGDVTQATAFMQSAFPEARMVFDPQTNRMTVWATQRDHGKIQQAVEDFGKAGSDADAKVLVSYNIRGEASLGLVLMFRRVVPQAQVIANQAGTKLHAWARPADQQIIKQIVTELVSGGADQADRSLQIYDVRTIGQATATEVLSTSVPDVSFHATSDGRALVAWVNPQQAKDVTEVLGQIAQSDPVRDARKLEVFPIGELGLANARQILTGLVPAVTFVDGADAKSLIAWVRAEESKQVSEALKRLNQEDVLKSDRTLEIYPVAELGAANARQILASVVPQLTFTGDDNVGALVAWVLPDEHTKIKDTLERLIKDKPFRDGNALKVYSTADLGGGDIATMIVSIIPTARVTPGTLGKHIAVWAKPDEHAQIAEALAQLAAAQQEHGDKVLEVYKLGNRVDPTALQTVLAPLVDADVQVTVDPTAERVFVRATAKKHAEFKTTLESIIKSLSEQKDLVTEVYSFPNADAVSALTAVTRLLPQATMTTDSRAQTLVVTASPADQATVKQVVEQMLVKSKGDSELKVYSTDDLGGGNIATMISGMVPTARVTPGTLGKHVAVWAKPDEHTQIAQALSQLADAQGEHGDKVLQVYKLGGRVDPTAIQTVLAPLVDADVQVTVDPTADRVFVRATPKKQAEFKETIESIIKSLSEQKDLVTEVYSFPNADAVSALTALARLLPQATMTTDSRAQALVVTASPEDQATVKQVVEQMLKKSKGDSTLKVYSTVDLGGGDIATMIAGMVPTGRVTPGTLGKHVAVWAKPDEHEQIAEALSQLAKAHEQQGEKTLEVYKLGHRVDAEAIQKVLEPLVDDDVQVTVDPTAERLFVRATPAKQATFKETIDSIIESLSEQQDLVTQVYSFPAGDADAAEEALQRLLPHATLTTDRRERALVATATAKDQQTIKQVVEELLQKSKDRNTRQAHAYRLKVADPENVRDVLQGLYVRDREVQISLDERNRTIMAVATRDQHAAIAALIEQIDKDGPSIEKRSVKSYELSTIDGEAAEEIVQTVVDRDDPTATIVFEPQSQQLVVSTTTSMHKQIGELVDSLQAKERELEVFQLEVLDASSASFTIDSLYGFGFGSPNAPTIESDEDTQQLLVRGTQTQIEQIRSVLIKMGETSLGLRDGGAAIRKNLRVFPLDGDADATIRRIEQLWPKLRNNPIRILRPSSNRLRRIGPSGADPIEQEPPQQEEKQDAKSPQSAIEPESPQDDALAALSTDEPVCVDGLCEPDTDDETQPAGTQPTGPTKVAAQQPNASDSESAPKPIVIIEGDRSLTIASDDLEALDQLETLLRALTRRKIGGSHGHEFVVYAMQNSGASAVVETLNQLYNTSRRGRGTALQLSSGNVVFVPDERLNAVIVYANRKDREKIEDLIQTLDTEQIPQSLQTNRTEVVLLKHAQAARVQTVIQSIYRAQMSPGRSRSSVSIPAGVPPEVASVLRQINASASSPLLTVEADETTNSLVVMAPATLLEEVTGLIEQLDETAGTNRAYGVTVIPLKKTNASTLMRALGRIAR